MFLRTFCFLSWCSFLLSQIPTRFLFPSGVSVDDKLTVFRKEGLNGNRKQLLFCFFYVFDVHLKLLYKFGAFGSFFFFFVGGGKGALKNQKLLLCWMFLSAQRPSLSNGVQKVAFPRSDVKKLAALFFPNFDFSAPFTPPRGVFVEGGDGCIYVFCCFFPNEQLFSPAFRHGYVQKQFLPFVHKITNNNCFSALLHQKKNRCYFCVVSHQAHVISCEYIYGVLPLQSYFFQRICFSVYFLRFDI